MMDFAQAYEIIMNSARILGVEKVDFLNATGRILAQDVLADADMPPFDKSLRDGYACRREDLSNVLEIVETIPAGCIPKKTIGKNQCAKIMTGAPIPDGADCVIMCEFVEKISESLIRFRGTYKEDFIHRKGMYLRKGDLILKKGKRLSLTDIAIMASVGCTNPNVYVRPKAGIIATGDELVEPNVPPEIHQIRNCNAYYLHAALSGIGILPKYYGIAKDSEESLVAMLKCALMESDVIIISGGVSVGELDIVPKVLKREGGKILIHTVSIKPGKPILFATADGCAVFGLPGNPIGTVVTFEMLAKPFLFRIMGHDFKPAELKMPISATLCRKDAERLEFFPVHINKDFQAEPIDYHGSGDIFALTKANGLIAMDIGIAKIEKGASVNVRQIWS